MAREVEQVVMKLKQCIAVPIILWDERLTSVQAKRILRQVKEKPSRNKKKVDAIASILLLQNYLDFQKGMTAKSHGGQV